MKVRNSNKGPIAFFLLLLLIVPIISVLVTYLPLGQHCQSAKAASPRSNKGDTELLAHLIHGEARGETFEGKVAIAAVIINRTKDARFPKTIAGVIYQPGAFTAISDGQANLQPDDISYKAAKDAIGGWDPSNGAVFYYNPSTATNKWIRTKKIVKKIGKHIFCK